MGPLRACRTHARSRPALGGRHGVASERRRADDDEDLGVGVVAVHEPVRQLAMDLDAVALVELVVLARDLGDDLAAQDDRALPRWRGCLRSRRWCRPGRATSDSTSNSPDVSAETSSYSSSRSGKFSLVRRSRRTTISRWAVPTRNWNIGTSNAWAIRRSELIDGSRRAPLDLAQRADRQVDLRRRAGRGSGRAGVARGGCPRRCSPSPGAVVIGRRAAGTLA